MRQTLDRISDIMQLFQKLEGSRPGAATTAGRSAGFSTQSEPSLPGTNIKPVSQEGRAESPLFQGMIERSARKHGVAPALIRAVLQAESGGRARARSAKGALGLMQLMPETAKRLGVDPLDPAQNIDGGVRYLKSMARRFDNLDQTLAAYNAGPNAVKKYGRVPPFRETRQYINRVRGYLQSLERAAESERPARIWRR